MLLALILLQAAPPASTAPPAEGLPDIQLDVHATANRVVVENRGRTSLTVHASVNGSEGDRSVVQVDSPELPQGQRELRNVTVRVHAEARVPDLQNPAPPQEPDPPR